MRKFSFRVYMRVDGRLCTKGFKVYAVDESMAKGVLRGQAADMGYEIIDIERVVL